MNLRNSIALQLGRPTGILGQIVGLVLHRANRVVNDWVISQLDIRPDDHILEIGFGPGQGIQHLAGLVPNGFVTGLDHSELMVRQARRRNRATIKAGRVMLKYGVIPPLPFDTAAFDKALAINVFYFWPEPSASLRELWRTLKPGGVLALYLATPESMKNISDSGVFGLYSLEQVEALLTQTGFIPLQRESRSFKAEDGFFVIAQKPPLTPP